MEVPTTSEQPHPHLAEQAVDAEQLFASVARSGLPKDRRHGAAPAPAGLPPAGGGVLRRRAGRPRARAAARTGAPGECEQRARSEGPPASGADLACAGRAVFRTTDGGATYDEVAKLTASDAAGGDRFGCSVAIAGDTVVVGARFDDVNGNDSGSVYVFRTTDGGATYSQVAKLTADRALGHVASDYFGSSVAIDGDTIVVGAYNDDDHGSNAGAAIIFRTSDGGASYVKVAKLTASDAAADDQFGKSVAIAGDTVVVGTSGHLQRLGRRRGRSWR